MDDIGINESLNSFTNPWAHKIVDPFESSSSDEDLYIQNTCVSNDLNYMMEFIDRKLPTQDQVPDKPLPESIASGGDTGIFRVPRRFAIEPDRPPCFDLRPRPLRETQSGRCIRTLCSSGRNVWAGHESGVRVWRLKDIYRAGCGAYLGDEDTCPFIGSRTTPGTLCLVSDDANGAAWSGHIDGKVRCWKMALSHGGSFKEFLSWQAHGGPVLSIVITSYGDIWSASEGGIIKVWPWETIEKVFSLTVEERHAASLFLEKSYIDLRSQVTVNGMCTMFDSDVRYLLLDNSTAKVWAAGYLSIALWDTHTRELLKVFNIDGQIESGIGMFSGHDFLVEDEVKVKITKVSKKEKQQGSFNFFQRSRNAIIGAADAVLRAAAKSAFCDDNLKIEALVTTLDGMIWIGCGNGLLVQWDGSGNRIYDFQYHSTSVQCFCTAGSRVWVGYASGTVQVLDLEGNLLGGWVAHSSSVIKMAIGAGFIFTLANHGGIRGWKVLSPGPFDTVMRSELARKEFFYTKVENLKILSCTWNVGQERASRDSLISWIGSAASDVDIVVVGLQEVEMGAGFLAMSIAKETVGIEGSSVGQWWLEMIGKILKEGSNFERLGSRQLAGLLIALWVRTSIRANVGDVDVAAVPCGFGRAIGNKGAVGLKIRVYDRVMCFVNCHFAAHLEAVGRRNADFDHVFRTMTFNRQSNLLNSAAAGVSSAVQMLRCTNTLGAQTVDHMPELSEADMVIFLGDFNYRLQGISYDETRDFISQRCFNWLRERDQLRTEMDAGNVFQGMREAAIRFPPTYKFERHQPGLAGYDSGEKKRIPAWCDRILYRDSRSTLITECSLQCPVVSSILQYDACMDVTDSDHKPVRCIFNVDIARVDESVRRLEFGDIIDSNKKIRYMIDELCKVPETIVNTNDIILQNLDTFTLRITNKSGKSKASFEIICEGETTIEEDGQASNHLPRGSFGFPRWLEITPAAGIIKPNQIMDVSVHHEEFGTLEEFVDGVPKNWRCKDIWDKEAILVVKVHGSCMTETKNHMIRVRQCLLTKTINGTLNYQTTPRESKKMSYIA